MAALSLNFLQLATIAFLISFFPVIIERRNQLLLAAGLGIPMLLYSDAVIWGITARGLYFAVIMLAFCSTGFLAQRFYSKQTSFVIGLMLWCAAVGTAMAEVVAFNRPDQGILVWLCATNFGAAFLYWRRFRPATTGVVTIAIGFHAWGAVFPCAALLERFAFSVQVESEIWNLPKYLVAVGMILTLLEKQIQRSDYLAYHDELTRLPQPAPAAGPYGTRPGPCQALPQPGGGLAARPGQLQGSERHLRASHRRPAVTTSRVAARYPYAWRRHAVAQRWRRVHRD